MPDYSAIRLSTAAIYQLKTCIFNYERPLEGCPHIHTYCRYHCAHTSYHFVGPSDACESQLAMFLLRLSLTGVRHRSSTAAFLSGRRRPASRCRGIDQRDCSGSFTESSYYMTAVVVASRPRRYRVQLFVCRNVF